MYFGAANPRTSFHQLNWDQIQYRPPIRSAPEFDPRTAVDMACAMINGTLNSVEEHTEDPRHRIHVERRMAHEMEMATLRRQKQRDKERQNTLAKAAIQAAEQQRLASLRPPEPTVAPTPIADRLVAANRAKWDRPAQPPRSITREEWSHAVTISFLMAVHELGPVEFAALKMEATLLDNREFLAFIESLHTVDL